MMINKEFKGNIKVTISDREVRVWVCNESGESVFRFKAIGKVHDGAAGVVVIPYGDKDDTAPDKQLTKARDLVDTLQNALNNAVEQRDKRVRQLVLGIFPDAQELFMRWAEDGWKCKGSPAGVCVYNVEKDPAMDDCLFCGLPSERR
jgi:hypothetical protein